MTHQKKRFLSAVRVGVATLVLALGGCASFSPDAGFGNVQTLTGERIAQTPVWVRTDEDAQRAQQALKQLLGAPLTSDNAVQVALINNPGLQATYAELGIAEADLVQAGRLLNPTFSYTNFVRPEGLVIERELLFNVMSLITLPVRTKIERQRFEAAKLRVTAQVVRVAADTRRAYYRAIAAQESATYAEQVKDAADASAELARRMAAAGNFSKLDQAREQVFYADATAQLARARQSAVSERERLTQLLGLWGQDIAFTLPQRLPDLPKAPRDVAELEKTALTKRLDVQTALKEAESVASSLGLTRATGFLNVLELGPHTGSEEGRRDRRGYVVELRLPIFDWGDARVARARYTYMQSVNQAAAVAVRARSEVREAFTAYRTAFDLARHYRDEVVPLRKRISDENVLRYSGMLISVFELLADARQQSAAVNAYIENLREFWVADATLDLALTGTSPGSIGSVGAGIQAAGSDDRAD